MGGKSNNVYIFAQLYRWWLRCCAFELGPSPRMDSMLYFENNVIYCSLFVAQDNPCDSNPCLYGATCHDDGILDYRCECTENLEGKNCDEGTGSKFWII